MKTFGLGLIALLLLSSLAFAATPRVRRSCAIGWDAPTTNADETPLTDLGGYRIYTSTTSGSYGAYTLQVNSSTTQATCRQLGLYAHNQTYYVRVTAIDQQDPANESTPSTEFSVVVTMGGIIVR